MVDYQLPGVTSVVTSHLGPISATRSTAHEDCSQGILGQPGSPFQMDQWGVQADAVGREHIQADTKAE